ncbi:MAG: TetR/AcrR family transcriptional regulator [Clostridiales bacterium]|jgi:AcrR family transcriptional regulator|nr:TetR/AcrR family transcriptional regulator [Clostridiales bacterium]
MSNARQRRHSEELRGRILENAQEIILEEGIEALSVRSVAGKMGYTAPIIYHYFRDKNELLSCAIREGYRKILACAAPVEAGLTPDQELRVSFKNFIDAALQVPHAYKSFILNFHSELLAENFVLSRSESDESQTLAKVISTLTAGVEAGVFAPCDVQLTAKIFWSSMFGLFVRLIVEPHVSQDEREALIERQFEVLIKGISA